jgi:branched-chain amino acid transport system substrate-binding protein
MINADVRSRAMKRQSLLSILVFPLLIAAAAAASAAEAIGAEPYRIGVNYGFSGAAKAWADYGKKGIELATDEINKAGGINGRPLKIIYEDNKTEAKESIAAYKKLTVNNGVDAIIASNWAIITNPLIPLSAKDKMIVISPTVMDASAEGRSAYFFTLGHQIESVRKPLQQFFNSHPSIRTAAFLCWDDAWGRANLRIWQEEAKARSVAVLATLCQRNYASDFRSEVSKVSALKPDVIFVGMYPERVALRMREQGVKVPIFTTSVVLEAIKDPALPADLFDRTFFAYWPSSYLFRKKFMARYGQEPLLEAENHYEAVRSLAKAFSGKANTLLENLKNVSYAGVTGWIDFGHSFIADRSGGSLMRIQNRTIDTVK